MDWLKYLEKLQSVSGANEVSDDLLAQYPQVGRFVQHVHLVASPTPDATLSIPLGGNYLEIKAKQPYHSAVRFAAAYLGGLPQ